MSENESVKPKRTRSIKRRLTAGIILLLEIMLLSLTPSYINAKLNEDTYRNWLTTETEPKTCIINVWHIVGFKPYIGSLGSFLKKQADEYSRGKIGIYFNVESYSPDEASEKLGRGMLPDVISFAGDSVDADMLYKLNGTVGSEASDTDNSLICALPYCASGRVMLCSPELSGASDEELSALCGTPEEFKKGKASACICDIRAAGDIYRAGLMGSVPVFDARPAVEAFYKDLVQYIGVYKTIDEYKLKYAVEYINTVAGQKAQSELCELGLLPISDDADADYEQAWIDALYELFKQRKYEIINK